MKKTKGVTSDGLLELGQIIFVYHRLERKVKYIPMKNKPHFNVRNKVWEEVKTNQKVVMVVGERTLRNGTSFWQEECGYVFEPKEYFKAILVVENLDRKPFYINYEKFKNDEMLKDCLEGRYS